MEPIFSAKREQYSVYIARCANGTFYIGYTTNVSQRLACHNAGQGGRYTRTNRPLTFIASWAFNSRREALQAERRLKRLSPERKWALVEASIFSLEEGNEYSRTETKQEHP
jgi:putative endonuclease